MFQTLFPGHDFLTASAKYSANFYLQQISRLEVLEHSLSSQLPRCLCGLIFPYLLTDKFTLSLSLSPLSVTSTNPCRMVWNRGPFSAATILMLPHESSSLRSWGQPGRRQGETRRSPSHCCSGKSTPWLDLWKTDLRTVTLISRWDLLPTGTTAELWRQLQVLLWSVHEDGKHAAILSHYCFRDDSLTDSVRSGDDRRLIDIFFSPAVTICSGSRVFTWTVRNRY